MKGGPRQGVSNRVGVHTHTRHTPQPPNPQPPAPTPSPNPPPFPMPRPLNFAPPYQIARSHLAGVISCVGARVLEEPHHALQVAQLLE